MSAVTPAAIEADANVEELEIQQGRRAPYSQQPDWISLAQIKHPSVRLYSLLAAHVHNGRRRNGDRAVWPTLDDLAEMMGYSRRDKITPFRDELVAIGAIEVEQIPVRGGGARTRSRYTVHETPPDDYDGPVSLGDFYAAKKARRRAQREAENSVAAGESRYPDRGTGPVPETGYGSRTRNEVRNKTKEQNEENQTGGPSAAPPEPPAARTPGRPEHGTSDQLNHRGNQQTARAEKPPGRLRLLYEAERAAARLCGYCDDAGLTPGGADCSHDPLHKVDSGPPAATLSDETHLGGGLAAG